MTPLAPVAIAVAPNGGRRGKADHPALPITPAELARTAAECLSAGAAMIHVHVRDALGQHLLDADAYHAAISAIRREVGEEMVIQVTSEALGHYAPGEQMSVIRETRPPAVSLALRELAPQSEDGDDTATEAEFSHFLHWLRQERIAPQVILYTPDEARRLADMQRRGLIPFDQPPVLYVLGRYNRNQTSYPTDLLPFLAPDQPDFHDFMVCAFGQHEAACTVMGGLLGGGLRVGFENNLQLPSGQQAASNADLVTSANNGLAALGVPLKSGSDLAGDWAKL